MSEEHTTPAYPNNVRALREKQHLTQAQLSALCAELNRAEPLRFVTVSVPAISVLESGRSKPRLATASTLAAALATTPTELFPTGLDDPRRNPTGKTRITPDRPKGGRPKRNA